jgi:protein subunit release factor B
MKEKELLFRLTKKDFIVEPFKGSGPGGQNKNKVMSCCRIYHPASGAVAQATEQRDFHQNKKVAFQRLVEKPEFKKWHKIEVSKALGNYIDAEKWVDEQFDSHANFKYEVSIDGKWVEIKPEEMKGDKDESL